MLSRRGFLIGMGAALAAPAVVRASSLMPVRTPLWTPAPAFYFGRGNIYVGDYVGDFVRFDIGKVAWRRIEGLSPAALTWRGE